MVASAAVVLAARTSRSPSVDRMFYVVELPDGISRAGFGLGRGGGGAGEISAPLAGGGDALEAFTLLYLRSAALSFPPLPCHSSLKLVSSSRRIERRSQEGPETFRTHPIS